MILAIIGVGSIRHGCWRGRRSNLVAETYWFSVGSKGRCYTGLSTDYIRLINPYQEPVRKLSHEVIVPLKQIEYGFGCIIVRPSYNPYSIYLRGTIDSSVVT